MRLGISLSLTQQLGGFSPASLFSGGQLGAWYDPSRLTTLFQDSAGTTPVTADGQPVGRMLDVSGRGNHVVQTVAGSRPLYKIDSTGRPYLQFDGTDDELTAPAVSLVGAPSVSAVVGQRKETDNTIGSLLLHGVATSPAGFWQVYSPRSTNVYGWRGFTTGNVAIDVSGGAFSQPDLSVLTGIFDPAAASGLQITGRRNGSVVAQGGTGLAPFVSTAFSIGKARTVGDQFFLGRVYGVIVLGAATSATTIANMENWMNGKTGAY